MQLRNNILKIKYTLVLIFSVLVMLLSIENCNAKSKSRVIIDSLKSLEGKIAQVNIKTENSLNELKNYQETNLNKYGINSFISLYLNIDIKYKENQKYHEKLVNDYMISCRIFRNIENRNKEYNNLVEIDKLHLKGKVGVLDNLVPIKWL